MSTSPVTQHNTQTCDLRVNYHANDPNTLTDNIKALGNFSISSFSPTPAKIFD